MASVFDLPRLAHRPVWTARRARRVLAGASCSVLAWTGSCSHAGPPATSFGAPEPVHVSGLPTGSGGTPLSTEEPYVSRDGRWLFFNSGESEGNKDLHYAERAEAEWSYRGALGPAINTPGAVEGNPTMDRAGNFYFVDSAVPQMLRVARFNADGRLAGATPVVGAPPRDVAFFRQRITGNMGVDVSGDGTTVYFDRATWRLRGFSVGLIEACDILLMTRTETGFTFDEREARRILANVNGPDIDYAESISADDLELFFTRLRGEDVASGNLRSRIMRAVRPSRDAPFGTPQVLESIGEDDFVEAPALSDDGRTLYYHQRVGAKFRLFRVHR